MKRYNVFVLGLNDFNRRKLERTSVAAQCNFIGLLDPDEILEATYFPIVDMLARAEAQIIAYGGRPDAVIGYVDFPVSTMIPIIARRFGLRAPTLESLLRCEHKYWSRWVQREVIPEHIPSFELVDPFGDDPGAALTLDYPFWIKPVKSAGSFLGFRVSNPAELEGALATIREHIGLFAEPFDHILDYATLPAEIATVGGHYCIAESLIGGRQCTLEGYVYDGAVHFHGVIDSIRARHRSTFLRYQYPSSLPQRVIWRMQSIAQQVLGYIEFDQSAFNIEFFWDAPADRIWLLEINTRIAQHHSDLFEKVDGVSNHQVVVDVALGRKPRFGHGEGAFAYAACCFLRYYRDGVVARVPDAADIAALAAQLPGIIFEPHVVVGTRLSELPHQETYSYALALLYLGAESPQALRERYRLCRRRLRFDIQPITDQGTAAMRRERIFPNPVRELDGVWIPMADGVQLAARVWLPEDAEADPVPAILEYIPYRKSDHTRPRDDLNHPYFAGYGYASVRVDIRGSGDSEGVLTDEYTAEELDDGVRIIEWLASQPWCDGNVGMIGISWGGFNGLQIAALQPAALKAVITVCSTDDRYADDVHYMGGCMLLDNLSWASVMFAGNACPPDPAVVGDNWRAMWLERLKGSGLWLDQWTRHQHRDEFWKHGSVCEDYRRIRCPVFAVSGWADGYSNAVFRLLANLDAPCKGLIGPWSHHYPHLGEADAAIGFLQESLRWWDHWLKGEATGIMDEPVLRVWMQDSIAPARRHAIRPGRWVGEPGWPSPHIREQRFTLGNGMLIDAEGDESFDDAPPQRICSPLKTGLMAGKWCSYADGPDLPGDQRDDDAGSLVFETTPLAEPLEILGQVIVELELAADCPTAMVAARLNDVRPDGRVTRVTYGLLNLTHRDSHEAPEPLEPGQRYRIRLALNDIAQRFPAGHRLRLALSSSYWPLVWPSPEPVTLTIYPAVSTLCLPLRPAREDDATLPELAPPSGAMPTPTTVIEPGSYDWQIVHDLDSGRFSLEVNDADGVYLLEDTGTQIEHRGRERYTAVGDDVHSVQGETHWTRAFRRDGWNVRTYTHTQMSADADSFYIHATLDAEEDGEPVYHDEWNISVPRGHV